MAMKMRQGIRQRNRKWHGFFNWKPVTYPEDLFEGLGNVLFRDDALSRQVLRVGIISQLHYVIKIPGGIIPTHMEDVDLAFVGSGDRFEALDACKLTFVRPPVLKLVSMDDFDRPIQPGHAPTQPDFAVTATANPSEQLVIRNKWRQRVHELVE